MIAALLVAAGPVGDVREVVVRTPALALGDLLPDAGLPMHLRARTLIRLPAGDRWTFERTALARLIRRQVPGLPVADLAKVRSISVRLAGDRQPGPERVCYETTAAITHDRPIDADDLGAVPCHGRERPSHLRFNRANGLTTASAPLPAQTYLGHVAPLRGVDVISGTALTLRSTAGPAIVERRVTAMQPGRNGGRLFVRDADGAVFAAPLALQQDAPR